MTLDEIQHRIEHREVTAALFAILGYLREREMLQAEPETNYAVLAEDWRQTCASAVKERDALRADLAASCEHIRQLVAVSGQLRTELRQQEQATHDVRVKLEAALDAVAAEREACALECDYERAACERHHKATPKTVNHKVGMQIAAVCAHRIRARGRKPDAESET